MRPGSRLAGIEGLRAIAACAIVVLHAWSILAAAGLIASPLLLYLLAVLLLKDALLVQELSPRTLSSGIEPAWSLSVEVTFYLLLPLLGLLGARLARRSPTRRGRLVASVAPALLLVLVAIAGKLVATFVVPGPEGALRDTWHSVIDRSFLTHADLFAAGMLVTVVRVEHEQARLRLSTWVWSLPATAFLAEHRLLLTGSAIWHVPIDFGIVVSVVISLAAITYLAAERPALGLRRRAATAPVPASSVLVAKPT